MSSTANHSSSNHLAEYVSSASLASSRPAFRTHEAWWEFKFVRASDKADILPDKDRSLTVFVVAVAVVVVVVAFISLSMRALHRLYPKTAISKASFFA